MRNQTLVKFIAISLAVAIAAGCGGAEQRKAKYLERGQKYLAQGNYQKARVEFGNAMQIDPKDAKAHYLAGQVAEKLTDLRGAVGQYQAAIDLDPKQFSARAALARLYVFGGAADQAIGIVEPGLLVEPNNPQLLVARGAARAKLGNDKEALQDAEQAFKLAPDDQYAVSLLSSLYKHAGRDQDALQVAETGVQREPGNVDLLVILASLEFDMNQNDKAEANLKKTVELEPANTQRRFYLARFYLLTKNIDAAEKTMREAVQADPQDVKTKMALVQFLAQNRSPDVAEAEIKKFIAAEPSNDELKLNLGDYSVSVNKLDQAESEYRAVVDHAGVKPDGLTARDRLASLALKRGDIQQAESLAADVLKENASDNDALMTRANIELGRRDATAAITDLRTILRAQPSNAVVLRTLARAHLRNKEPTLAEEVLRTAVQANPKDIDSRFELAQLLSQTGKADQAKTLLEQVAADAPQNLVVVEQLFRVEMAQKDYVSALALAEKTEREHADSPLGFYFAGLVDEAQQKPDAAIANYDKALAINPLGAEPLTAIMGIQAGRKQYKPAMDRLDAMIAKYPDDMLPRSLKGELLIAQKQFEPAAQTYQDAIAKNPKIWTLYRGLATAQLGADHRDAAMSSLAQGISANPEAIELSSMLALLYEHAGRIDDAVAVYEAAAKRTPGSQEIANNYAMLLANHKQDAASLARAQQLADQLANATAPSFLDTRGWVKYKSGDYKGAIPIFQQAVDAAPNSSSLLYHLALAQEKNGDPAGAVKNLKAAMKPGRPFEGSDDARAALQRLEPGAAG